MSDTTDIEKKSLEAHVELCAERYRFLETKLENLETKINDINSVIREIHDDILAVGDKHNRQIMTFGIGLTSVLLTIIGYLLTKYVF